MRAAMEVRGFELKSRFIVGVIRTELKEKNYLRTVRYRGYSFERFYICKTVWWRLSALTDSNIPFPLFPIVVVRL